MYYITFMLCLARGGSLVDGGKEQTTWILPSLRVRSEKQPITTSGLP